MCLMCEGYTEEEMVARWVTHVQPTRFGTVHHKNLVSEWFARWPQVAAACGETSAGLRAARHRRRR